MMTMRRQLICLVFALTSMQIFAEVNSFADDIEKFNFALDYKILFLGGFFVILMQAGFAVVEGGYEKNSKSLQNLCINYFSALLGGAFFGAVSMLIGYLGWVETDKPIFSILQGWHWNLIFFYSLMATTITTVVGRIIPSSSSLMVFLLVGFFISGIIFPVYSSWVWGSLLFDGGWLKQIGFIDFAGSTVVHSTAAWIVLAGYFVLRSEQKQQIQKRDIIFDDYKVLSMALAGFILWLAWSGLNVIYISAIHVDVATIVVNSVVALLGAVISALCLSLLFYKQPSWEALIKAALGGLVAITASCGFVSLSASIIIGIISGALTLFVPTLLSRWIHAKNIREVVVIHGLCGVWGTLAIPFTNNVVVEQMGQATLVSQITGVSISFIWSFGLAYLLFKTIYMVKLKLGKYGNENKIV